MTDKQNVNTNC